MLTGRSIGDIAQELDRQRKSKLDFIIPTSFLGMTIDSRLCNKHTKEEIPLTEYAHGQLATYLDIPTAYYGRMKSKTPELLKTSVETWIAQQSSGNRRMIRTMDGTVRAVLSDRFLCIDHWDTLSVLLPAIQEAGCEIVSAEITDRKMYVKAITPKITGEVAKGDIVQAGVIISNSEIGAGSVTVQPLLYRLACLNGLILQDMSLKRSHLGRRINENLIGENHHYTRETIALDIAAFLSKAKDTVKAVLDQTVFNSIVEKARNASTEAISDPAEAVENVTSKYSLFENESTGVLNALLRGQDFTRWGLVNAIISTAHEIVKDYDRSTELEKIGGEVLCRR